MMRCKGIEEILSKTLITFFVIIVILSGCNQKTEDSTSGNVGNDTGGLVSNNGGYDDVEEQLLTKEEFLKLVSENEDVLGVTVKDFKKIDVDDFIKELNLTETSFEWFITGGLIFEAFFNSYVSNLETREIKSYLPQKLVVAGSTDEEYERFINEYIKRMGGRLKVSTHDFIPDMYVINMMEDNETDFIIYKTQDIETLKKEEGWIFVEDPCFVEIPYIENMIDRYELYLSKNGKFFIIFYTGPCDVKTVKTFCEIDD